MLHKELNDFHTRRSERAPFKCAVSFRTREGKISYGWSRDISLGGIYVVTDDRQRIGTVCEVALTVTWDGATQRVTMHGQVARYDRDGIALQFCALPDTARALIEEIVEAHIRAEIAAITGREEADAADGVDAVDPQADDPDPAIPATPNP